VIRHWFAFKPTGTCVYAGTDILAAFAAADNTQGPILSIEVEEGQRLPNAIRYVGSSREIEVVLDDVPAARPM